MKTIIAGSRTINDYALVEKAVADSGFQITEVVSGGQRTYDPSTRRIVGGVDWLGEKWAVKHQKPVRRFPASWRELGKAAGPVRNAEMAEYAEALICIHTGSKGSLNMIKLATACGLKVYVHLVK